MLKFEDKIDCINRLIQKNRGRWHLGDIGGVGFEDIAQTIRLHIYNKWDQWDQNRPFDCWCNKIVIHQIKNCVRNIYSKDAPPCSNCPFDRGGDLCGYTNSGLKGSECASFKKWAKKKQDKYLIKNASSINAENFQERQDFSDFGNAIKLETSIEKFHTYICQFLNQRMGNFYKMIYVQNLTDNEVINKLKQETGRGITKRQLFLIKKNLQAVAKLKISEFDPDHE